MNDGTGRNPVVLIAGPTAGGKSAVAYELARTNAGMIINADALQVYRELRILTARPTPSEERAVPHRLYGTVSASRPYSVGLWLDAARTAIADAWSLNRMPIVVGGTGLYFKALEQGLVRLPPIPPTTRQKWRHKLERQGPASLYEELMSLNRAEATRLRPSDGQRIVRALEILDATGKPLSAWHAESSAPGFLATCRALKLFLSPPREHLYKRIDRRFDEMVELGAMAEVQELLRQSLDPSLPAMKAIGVGELAAVAGGELALDEACRIAKRNIRRYAKRQLTWARRNMISWNWISEQLMEQTRGYFFNFIRRVG
jgi:tRNA dimethylallyltransferase